MMNTPSKYDWVDVNKIYEIWRLYQYQDQRVIWEEFLKERLGF